MKHLKQIAKAAMVKDENGLLPCPFCGGEAELMFSVSPPLSSREKEWHASCKGKDCGVYCDTYCEGTQTKKKAIEAWNTRTFSPQTVLELIERVEKYRKALEEIQLTESIVDIGVILDRILEGDGVE